MSLVWKPKEKSFVWMLRLQRLTSIVPEQKSLIGQSRGGASTKIHAVVDTYGYPVFLLLNQGQRNDMNRTISMLEHVSLKGSQVLAVRGYDSHAWIDTICEHGGEPTIPFRKGAIFERHCN